MNNFLIYLFWLVLGFQVLKSNAQSDSIKSIHSINVGLEYDLLSNEEFWNGKFPRLSYQNKKIEIGGFFLISNVQNNSGLVNSLIKEKSKLNLFVRAYLWNERNLTVELGFVNRKRINERYARLTFFGSNPVTGLPSFYTINSRFEIENSYSGFYCAAGYSGLISNKGLYIDIQFKYNIGNNIKSNYVHENLTLEEDNTNYDDPSEHRFYLKEVKGIIGFWNLTLGLTYKFGLK